MKGFLPELKIKLSFINRKIFMLFLVALLFIGCSNSAPDVLRTDCTVVLTYDQEGVSESRLSVFAQSGVDVRRCQRIKVHSIEGKYLWETDEIRKIAMGTFQWAGNCNLVLPEGEKVPQGQYEITYINADEEQQISYANLKYNEKLYNMKSEDIAATMTDNGSHYLAIFDSSDILLFFGEPTEDFYTTTDMLEKYNNASYYKDVWITYDNSVICILPKNQL